MDRMQRTILIASAAASLAPATRTALAQTVHALDPDVDTGLCSSNRDQNVGWQFDVNEPIAVTALTWFDQFGNGLTLSHEVAVWNPDGTLVAGPVVIPAGSEATLDDIWRRIDVTPVEIGVNEGYIVGGFNGADQPDCLLFDADQTVDSRIAYVDAVFSDFATSLERPTKFSTAETGLYGPSFMIGTTTGDLVIEREGACPGDNTVHVEHAVPGELVCLLYAATTGRYEIAEGFLCAGTRLGLSGRWLRVVDEGHADDTGRITFVREAGIDACGGWVQAIGTSTCTTSNLVRID